MIAPIWIVVFDRSGKQWTIVRCAHTLEADRTIYHNTYYGCRCLQIKVKEWK